MVSLNKKSLTFILYDWATSPITTIHTTFIFSVYFVEKIAVENGSFLWGVIIAIASILTALFGPTLGSYADKKRKRKLILFILTILGGFSTMLLWFAKPSVEYLLFASILSCISILTMEVVFVLYNSLLSTSTDKKNYGILSGLSWAAGYLAGIISLLLCLTFFILPEKLIFDLTRENGENIRACMLFISIWMLIFVIPLFIIISEPEKNKTKKSTLAYLKQGCLFILKEKLILRFFLSRLFYFDALATLFAFGGIYASNVFDFSTKEILYFAILINLSAALGATIGGFYDRIISSFRVIQCCIISLIVFGIFLILIKDEIYFWIVSFFLGLFIGPLQSSSRVLISDLVPSKKGGQFFGFAIFSGKITSFLGPLVYGFLILIFDDHRIGMSFVIILLIFSFLILGQKNPLLKNYRSFN